MGRRSSMAKALFVCGVFLAIVHHFSLFQASFYCLNCASLPPELREFSACCVCWQGFIFPIFPLMWAALLIVIAYAVENSDIAKWLIWAILLALGVYNIISLLVWFCGRVSGTGVPPEPCCFCMFDPTPSSFPQKQTLWASLSLPVLGAIVALKMSPEAAQEVINERTSYKMLLRFVVDLPDLILSTTDMLWFGISWYSLLDMSSSIIMFISYVVFRFVIPAVRYLFCDLVAPAVCTGVRGAVTEAQEAVKGAGDRVSGAIDEAEAAVRV